MNKYLKYNFRGNTAAADREGQPHTQKTPTSSTEQFQAAAVRQGKPHALPRPSQKKCSSRGAKDRSPTKSVKSYNM